MGIMYRSGDYLNNMPTNTYGKIFIENNNVFKDSTSLFISQRMNIDTTKSEMLVKIGNGIINCYRMFDSCYNLNQHINIPNKVVNCGYMFNFCYSFNQPINISNNVDNCCYMFYRCTNFNSPVIIGNNVTNCLRMFDHCNKFNQPINIPDSVTDCYYMFDNCTNFNQPINIPDNSLTNCNGIFSNCFNFNQPISIPYNTVNCNSMFRLCRSMTSDIKVYGEQKNVYCLLYNAHYDIGNSKYLRMNIYCKNAVPFLGNKETNSITGYNTTWTAITNGYYNALYNIYIYNNLT